MSMTFDQAIAALGDPQHQTLDGLKQLVSLVSVDIQNEATTLFYSGAIDDIPTWKIAGQIATASDGKVATIDQTDVARFLNHDAFKVALTSITGEEEFSSAYNGTANPDGTRTPGMWDIASENLAKAASGDVRTLTPLAEQGKTFVQTELPAPLLDNPNVKSINGVSTEVLRANYERGGRSAATLLEIAKTVDAASADMLIASGMRIVKASNGSIAAVDTGKYFSDLGISSPSLPAGQGTTLADNLLKGATSEQIELLKQGRELLQQIDEIPGAHAAGTVARRGLPGPLDRRTTPAAANTHGRLAA
jgi:hypothetical protein